MNRGTTPSLSDSKFSGYEFSLLLLVEFRGDCRNSVELLRGVIRHEPFQLEEIRANYLEEFLHLDN